MRTVVLFFLFAWLLCFQPCSAGDTLNAGERLTESGNHNILVSEGQNFTLGFFSPPESKHKYLGIWYNRSEESEPQIVVWVANRDNPIQDSSSGVVEIAADGNLVVTDKSGNGKTYWSSELEGSASRNRTLKLTDSGNLVLWDHHLGKSYPLWQSFNHPTDTFLPGMKMDANLYLTSWRSVSDPGIGSFTFKMAPAGNNRYVVFEKNKLHWESDGLNSEAISPEILNLLANFTFNNSSHTLYNITFTMESQSSDYHNARIFMNDTGEIQYLKRPQGESQWSIEWREPEDKCSIYNSCGKFNSCNKNNQKHCRCLPGFSSENQNFEEGGACVRKSTSCAIDELMFLNLTMIKVGNPDKQVPARTEADCRSECLGSCPLCQAYSYNDSTYSKRGDDSLTCGIWTRDLPSLQEERNGGIDLAILVKTSDIAPTAKSCEPCGTNVIPYPLSTGPKCGDPMYNKFNCNVISGQVSFVVPGDQSYRVTRIDEDARKFFIKTRDDQCGEEKPNFPFSAIDWCSGEDEIDVSWQPPSEPPCSKAIDCKNWPYSTCKATRKGKTRCLCDSKYQWNAVNLSCTQEPSRKRWHLILTVTLASIIFLACTIIFAYVWRKRLGHNQDRVSIQIQESLNDCERHVKGLIGLGGLIEQDSEGIEVPCYTFASIIAATDNFSDSNKLGRGGYGPVYKGKFPGGQVIAIKRLSSLSTQGLQEFKNEVVLIAKLQHRNLVRLRGYCIKGDEKILLYEYMPNKSLDSFIFDRTRTVILDWKMRFDISIGIARGLLYLHQDSRLRVIHRDFKTSNILLDEEMNPKISDFGLAKIFGGKETEASTERIVGTYGYMAPEYALDGLFSIKSDVFSFGVVLLEILSGKRNTGFYESKQISSLLGYAWRLWTENKLLGLMDPSLGETCDENQFIKCALIGLLCVQDQPDDRPTMSHVVIMLESEAATIPTPTQPTFFVSRSRGLSSTASSSSKPEASLQLDSSYQGGR